MMHEFFGPEQPTQRRFNAKCLKEAFRHEDARGRYWLAASYEFEIVGRRKGEVTADGLERVVLLLEILGSICGVGFTGFASFRILLHNPHQMPRIAKWQRSQQNCVDHAEDSDICPDAESENQYS